MKKLLTCLTVIFLASTQVMAEEGVFKCAGQYDQYDDTCYLEDGTYKHYEFADGERQILNENDKYFGRYYWWSGGYPYGYYPYSYPYYGGFRGGFRGRGYGRGYGRGHGRGHGRGYGRGHRGGH